MGSLTSLWTKLLQLHTSDFASYDFPVLRELWQNIVSQSIHYYPHFARALYYVVDVIFCPKQIIKQIVIFGCVQFSLVCIHRVQFWGEFLKSFLFTKQAQIKTLRSQMHAAADYYEWRRIASKLDNLLGNLDWIEEDVSPLYNYQMVRQQLTRIERMIHGWDIFGLMFRLRGTLCRNQYGMLHEGLYSKAHSGTKTLIREYHETVVNSLFFIANSESDEEIPTDAKLAFFNETRHCFGRTALLLSGGAYLGFYHIGVVKELFERGLMPRIISGASAGSLITAAIGVRTDDELALLNEHTIPRLDHLLFDWETRGLSSDWAIRHQLMQTVPGWLTRVVDFFFGVFIDGKKVLKLDTDRLVEVTIQNVGHYTFQEAFDRTGRIINITVAPVNSFDPPRLLNYLTAPHVCVWSAAVASCAIPGVFASVPLIVKEPSGRYTEEHIWSRQGPSSLQSPEDTSHMDRAFRYSDGSVESDLPMEQLGELFNVNHFIVCQVNPHSPLLSAFTAEASVWSSLLYSSVADIASFLLNGLRSYLRNIIDLVVYRALASEWSTKRGLIQVLVQDYGGRDCDVTLTPWKRHLSIPQALMTVMKNPTRNEIKKLIVVSRMSVWPQLAKIEAHCRIEFALDSCVQILRRRVAQELEAVATDNEAVQGDANATDDLHSVHSPGSNASLSSYTSRSIVNLSGLSVSDPQPQITAAPVHRDQFYPASVDSQVMADDTPQSALSTPEQDGPARSYSIGDFVISPGRDDLAVSDASHTLKVSRSASFRRRKSMADFYYQHDDQEHNDDDERK